MGFITVRGSNLYYEEKGLGPPILLIHPSGATASTWGDPFNDLAGVGRVIAYDRRGYSRSIGEVVRSAPAHTADAIAVLEALAATPAVAVGTSAGATLALDLAVRRPDLVRAVVAHEAPWRALRHPTPSGLGTLARLARPLRRGSRNPAALGLRVSRRWQRLGRLSRGVATSREGERQIRPRRSAKHHGWLSPSQGPGEDSLPGRVHVWCAKPQLHALHHPVPRTGHPDGPGA
jgi:pimeloyl-ACP methyl ester carboxylesterase